MILTIRYSDDCPPCREVEAAIEADGPLKDYIDEHLVVEWIEAKGKELRPIFFVGDQSTMGYQGATNLLAWLKSQVNPEGIEE